MLFLSFPGFFFSCIFSSPSPPSFGPELVRLADYHPIRVRWQPAVKVDRSHVYANRLCMKPFCFCFWKKWTFRVLICPFLYVKRPNCHSVPYSWYFCISSPLLFQLVLLPQLSKSWCFVEPLFPPPTFLRNNVFTFIYPSGFFLIKMCMTADLVRREEKEEETECRSSQKKQENQEVASTLVSPNQGAWLPKVLQFKPSQILL